jgi:sulfatase modifying factor 1
MPSLLRTRLARPTALLIAPLVALVLAGCEGDTGIPPAQPAAQPAQAAAPDPNANDPPAAPQAPAQPAAHPPVVAAEPEPDPPSLDPNVDRHDVFVVTSSLPTFEHTPEEDGTPKSAHTALATPPPQGWDSQSFEAIEVPDPPQPAAASSTSGTDTPSTDDTQTTKKPEKKATPGKKTSSTPSSTTKSSTAKTRDADQSEESATKTLPSGFTPVAAFGYAPVGWPVRIRCDKDGAEMAFITGGAATVGHDGEPEESSPQITVVVDSFYMDITETTLARYERYRKSFNEERGRNAAPIPANSTSPPSFPALGLTYKQAEFYSKWAQKALPTEAEWERAARGEGAFPHPWGNGRAIWSQHRKRDTITAVKSFGTDVSPFGIYDLAGNAREWCLDHWSPTAFTAAHKASARNQLRNWKGPRTADPVNFHVVKGNGPGWDAWYREGMDATLHHPNVGFRCVLRLSDKN